LFVLALFFAAVSARAQTKIHALTEVIEGHSVGGVTVDALGNIYVADFGEIVWKLTPEGERHEFASGLYGASGNAIDNEGNLLQSNFYGDSITKIDRKGQAKPLVTSGLSGPVGIAIDKKTGDFYVANCRGNSIAKVAKDGTVSSFAKSDLFNCPNGISFDREGNLFVSCRNDGTIHRITPDGRAEEWMVGMGIATGIAFDQAGNLFVGDRSGTIFKISPSREIFVFATLEPSIAAYHLAFHPSGDLYVTGPTTSSFDRVHRITQGGDVSVFFRGLGRPQGLAFDRDANLYVAGSFGGRRGIVRISPQAHADVVLSGSGLVGLALQPSGRAILATTGALFTLDWDVRGLPLAAQ